MHPNVLAALEQSQIAYRVHRHADFGVPIRRPQDFANALGYDIARITKTLLLRCTEQTAYVLAICSVPKKVNLALVAAHLECKRMELATPANLDELLGYPPTGVSPLIGAGVAGVELELAPHLLRDLTDAVVLPLTL